MKPSNDRPEGQGRPPRGALAAVNAFIHGLVHPGAKTGRRAKPHEPAHSFVRGTGGKMAAVTSLEKEKAVADASQQFRFVVDRIHAGTLAAPERRAGRAAAGTPEVLDVQWGAPSGLVVGEDGVPRLVPAADAPDDAVLIEPVLAGPQPELLMVSRGGPRLRVNGQPAPLVALLAERDQLQLSEDLILHVATYHEPRIGRPSPDQVSRVCPLCRVVIAPTTIVYTCWACGLPMHLEGDGLDKLDCARAVKTCANCRTARIILEPQYASFPEEIGRD